MPQRAPSPPRPASRQPSHFPAELRGVLRRLEQAMVRRPQPHPGGYDSHPGSLTVASYNVHRCIGMDKRFDPGRVAAVIEELDADIVALQEADRRFGHRAGLLELGEVERRTGLTLVHASPVAGGHGWRGNALLVRGGTIHTVRRLALPGAEPRGALIVDLTLPGGRLRVAAAHLGLLRRHRAQQARAILAALAEGEAMPSLLLGDLNEWRSGIHSSLAVLQPFFGPFGPPRPSFPSRLPFMALDRILGHPRGLVMRRQVHDSALARIASDHLPIRARIDLAAIEAAQLRLAA